MRISAIGIAMVLALTAGSGLQASTIRTFHKVVALDGTGRLSIDTHNGSVTVTTWKQPSVQIDARIEADPESDTPEDVDKTNIKVTGSGSSVRIESDYSAVQSRNSWLGLTVSEVSAHVNGGGPQLHFSSHNGMLHLIKQ